MTSSSSFPQGSRSCIVNEYIHCNSNIILEVTVERTHIEPDSMYVVEFVVAEKSKCFLSAARIICSILSKKKHGKLLCSL